MIIVENLSKKYQHSNEKRVPMTLRETLYNLGGKFFQRSWKPTKANEFYALRSVEFKVEAGEVIGIIGRNGAGKSTLLKIMSRITFPDTGSVTLNGRVGSLLEIGAGFNQELTGRENVFLSGAILGMSHREIVDKYEEIVEFAGVGKFIDDPVKRYSSGMYLRLAFSVAAYLEPEILLLDEILGVGDMEFQDRCLAKIRDLSKFEGRTVLLISHNLNTIAELCPRTLWFDAGRLQMDGETSEVIAAYKQFASESPSFFDSEKLSTEIGNENVRLRRAGITDRNGQVIERIDVSEEFYIEIEFDVLTDKQIILPRLEFCNESDACLFWIFETDSEWANRERQVGCYKSTVTVPANLLNEGKLNINVAIYSITPSFGVNVDAPNLISLEVTDRMEKGGARGEYPFYIPGFIRPALKWTGKKV